MERFIRVFGRAKDVVIGMVHVRALPGRHSANRLGGYLRVSYMYAASRYCFWRRLSVCICLSVRTKSRKLLVRNLCNLVRICPMVNAKSGWKLVTLDFDLDLDSYFRIFLIQAILFEWLYLSASFSVWRYIFRISRSPSSFNVMG